MQEIGEMREGREHCSVILSAEHAGMKIQFQAKLYLCQHYLCLDLVPNTHRNDPKLADLISSQCRISFCSPVSVSLTGCLASKWSAEQRITICRFVFVSGVQISLYLHSQKADPIYNTVYSISLSICNMCATSTFVN